MQHGPGISSGVVLHVRCKVCTVGGEATETKERNIMVISTHGNVRVEAVIRAPLTGAPQTPVTHLSRDIQPDYIYIKYRFESHGWVASSAEVTGFRVLKPATDGTQLLGKGTHRAYWHTIRGDVQADTNLPEWLDTLVSALRPTGDVTVPFDN